MSRIVVGITGASGVIYGVRLLEVLSRANANVHLVYSQAAIKNLEIETSYKVADLDALASVIYDINDIGGAIASGSFKTDGMIVAPCSIKTLSAIANSFNFNLLIRAADVSLKERRKLVLMVRETPLHEGHLELMMKVVRMGGVILPPVPAFYHQPKSLDDIVNQTVGKILDQFSIEENLFKRWGEETEGKELVK
ncbi:MAG: UbiX family flavin prenyltransferase [Clostridiaceae bacterium]|jgi:4-hydroxy-3-polyprenylbenzoate decarboxylase|nr:UbiX family flavin prenyltransferase [Clostridiaceae bacterium]